MCLSVRSLLENSRGTILLGMACQCQEENAMARNLKNQAGNAHISSEEGKSSVRDFLSLLVHTRLFRKLEECIALRDTANVTFYLVMLDGAEP